MPKRIQRKRSRGWRMPEGAVYVGRQSKWGNPFVLYPLNRTLVVDAFRRLLRETGAWWPVRMPWPAGKIPAGAPTTIADVRRELAGKDLACWCPLDQPCHADVLLEIANAPEVRLCAAAEELGLETLHALGNMAAIAANELEKQP